MVEPMHFGDARLPVTFWERAMPELNSGCWLWMGSAASAGGYGSFGSARAHRVALEAALGEPLGELWALHRCDNPPCVNPNHLFAGTVKDNVQDMWAKQRAAGATAENASKTHCHRGHPLTADNVFTSSIHKGWRACRICQRDRDAIRDHNLRALRLSDDLCQERSCVNPNHVEPAPISENTRRGIGPTAINQRKTHCKSGHALTEDNVQRKSGSPNWRQCRICKRRRSAAYRARETAKRRAARSRQSGGRP